MTTAPQFIGVPTAMVSGASAWLIARILRSPNVIKVRTNPPSGLDRADIAATVRAIHEAGRAWENSLALQQRDNAVALSAVVPHCWTTQQTAMYLRLSLRRVQELAPELGGRRNGRQWLIPAAAVRAYEQQRAGNAA